MKLYLYCALNTEGKKVKGKLYADSIHDAQQKLQTMQLYPLKIHAHSSPFSRLYQRRLWHPRFLTEFCMQLANLLCAQISLQDSFATLAAQYQNDTHYKFVQYLKTALEHGKDLTETLQSIRPKLPNTFISAVKTGMKTGKLPQTLATIAQHMQDAQTLKQKIIQATLYPLIVSTIALMIIIGLLAYVVPMLIATLSENNQTLPLATRILLHISQVVIQIKYGILLTVLFCLFLIFYRKRNTQWRYRSDQYLLKLPLMGSWLKNYNVHTFLQTCAIAAQSHLPLLDTLSLAQFNMSSLPLKARLTPLIEQLKTGSTFTDACIHSALFKPLIIHTLQQGERSGTLADSFSRAANMVHRELDSHIQYTLSLFEPLLIIGVGFCIMFIVLAVLLPIFQMEQVIL